MIKEIYDSQNKHNKISSLNLLPNYLNLFDNFENIQYKGIYMPRIQINTNKILNLEKLLYSSDFDNNQLKEKNTLNKEELYVVIEDKDKENDNINITNKNKEKSSFTMIEKNIKSKNSSLISNEYKSNLYQNDFSIKEVDNLEPQPPQIFISIIIGNESQNQQNSNLKKNDKNINKTINNLILNNLNLISNINYMNLNYNPFLNYAFINKIMFPKIPSDSISTNLLIQDSNLNLFNTIFTPFPFIYNSKYENKKILLKRVKKKDIFNRKVHSAADDDNILRKIQVHFLSFIVNFTNDIICAFITGKDIPLFKNLDYKIKKVVNHKSVEILKNKTVGEILQLRVSPKMKINHENVNRNTYYVILEKLPFIHEYFEMKYLTLFKEYYTNQNKVFEVNGKTIQISVKTKTFKDLIKKNHRFSERLKYVSINYILNTYKRMKRPNFKILTH